MADREAFTIATDANELPIADDADFRAALVLLEAVVSGDVMTEIVLSREEAKAVCRYIMRLQQLTCSVGIQEGNANG